MSQSRPDLVSVGRIVHVHSAGRQHSSIRRMELVLSVETFLTDLYRIPKWWIEIVNPTDANDAYMLEVIPIGPHGNAPLQTSLRASDDEKGTGANNEQTMNFRMNQHGRLVLQQFPVITQDVMQGRGFRPSPEIQKLLQLQKTATAGAGTEEKLVPEWLGELFQNAEIPIQLKRLQNFNVTNEQSPFQRLRACLDMATIRVSRSDALMDRPWTSNKPQDTTNLPLL